MFSELGVVLGFIFNSSEVSSNLNLKWNFFKRHFSLFYYSLINIYGIKDKEIIKIGFIEITLIDKVTVKTKNFRISMK